MNYFKMEKKMFNIFNMKKNSVQNKMIVSDCQNNSHHTKEHVEKQNITTEYNNITTDSNINIVITVDLGNWDWSCTSKVKGMYLIS